MRSSEVENMVAEEQAEDAGTMRQRFEGQVFILAMMWGIVGAACTHALLLVKEFSVFQSAQESSVLVGG